MLNLDKCLVSPDKVIRVVKAKFPDYVRYATGNHTVYTTNKVCHKQHKEVLEYLKAIGYMAS